VWGEALALGLVEALDRIIHGVVEGSAGSGCQNRGVRISAKADYAVRAAVTLAALDGDAPVKAERVASEQDIPLNFLENILHQLKASGIVTSHRGPEGGFRLARPADVVTLADVIRAVDGPLASVRGSRPEQVSYTGAAEPLQEVWIALRANLRAVLEHVTLADVAAGKLPADVRALTKDRSAWEAPAFER
jgi:Rrf2 family protein